MHLYKKLTEEEEIEYREWARETYTPLTEIHTVWHPVIKDECNRMNEEIIRHQQ
jgi:hypothetical protein